jgi:hypothetical protein
MKHIIYVAFVLITFGCKVSPVATTQPGEQRIEVFPGYEQLSATDRDRADSLIAFALDHEALYSLMADLKPISSIGFSLSFPLGKDSTQQDGQHDVVNVSADSVQTLIRDLESWYRVVDALSFGDYQFMLLPFRQVWDGKRNMQVLLCRADLIDDLLEEQAPFFAQWGFVPGTDPAVLLTAIEFEDKHDRFRSYGYLFGYPRHAVDFFVEASLEQEETGEFVSRDFFQIPVYAGEKGYFTYAVPKDYETGSRDSLIYNSAQKVLEEYRELRPQYLDKQGNLEAIELYRDWWNRQE